MGLRINNNIAALNSYNNVNKTDKAVSSSLEKLSSGFRINKAADDAAGLVVSEKLRSQIGGLTVAARNAQDGVNVVQTADGALGTVSNILQRMRDLAVQASNTGSADSTAAAAANTEFGKLSDEITRISTTTKFGSQPLLTGNYGATAAKQTYVDADGSFEVVAGDNDSFNLNVAGIGDVAVTVQAGTYTSGASFATALEGAIKTALTNSAVAGAPALASKVKVTSDTVGAGAAITISADIADKTTKSFTITENGGDFAADFLGSATPGASAVAAGSQAVFQIGADLGEYEGVTIGKIDSSSDGLALDALDLRTLAGAQAALTAVANAITTVSNTRAELGATQNRFEYAIANINTSIENITASESAIRDTDMAAEMTKFTKNQILSQAGTSMLAQANSSTQNILTLLRG
jgi:flagellin